MVKQCNFFDGLTHKTMKPLKLREVILNKTMAKGSLGEMVIKFVSTHVQKHVGI